MPSEQRNQTRAYRLDSDGNEVDVELAQVNPEEQLTIREGQTGAIYATSNTSDTVGASNTSIPLSEIDMTQYQYFNEPVTIDNSFWESEDEEVETHYCQDCDIGSDEVEVSDYHGALLCDDCIAERDERDEIAQSEGTQSDTQGKIIKSMRKFGVEIECIANDMTIYNNISNEISRAYDIVRDSSIQSALGKEIVSPILKGGAGEKSLQDTCEKLKGKFHVDKSTGLHVHLDVSHLRVGKDSLSTIDLTDMDALDKLLTLENISSDDVLFLSKDASNFVGRNMGVHDFFLKMTREGENMDGDKIYLPFSSYISYKDLDHVFENCIVRYGKTAFWSRGDKEKIMKRYVLTNEIPNLKEKAKKLLIESTDLPPDMPIEEWSFRRQEIVKAILFFVSESPIHHFQDLIGCYSFFLKSDDDSSVEVSKIYDTYNTIAPILESMLPTTRRNTHFCKNVSELKLKEGDNFKDKLYGKGRHDSNKYSDMRYYGVNFHSIYYRGTLEIRYHSGTINADKILNWVSLHQTILDTIEAKTPKEIAKFVEEMKTYYSLSRKLNCAKDFFNLNTKTIGYIKERIGKFEGDKIVFKGRLTTKEE